MDEIDWTKTGERKQVGRKMGLPYRYNTKRDVANLYAYIDKLKTFYSENGLFLCVCDETKVNNSTRIRKNSIFHRDCDVSCNCKNPVSKSEYSVLTFLRNRALFIFLFVKMMAFLVNWKNLRFCAATN